MHYPPVERNPAVLSPGAAADPGAWYIIHSFARSADQHRANQVNFGLAFITYMEDLAANFKCVVCQPHLQAFLARYPPATYLSREDGLWRWTVDLHNDVNRRTGKPIVSYGEAAELHTSECNNCQGISIAGQVTSGEHNKTNGRHPTPEISTPGRSGPVVSFPTEVLPPPNSPPSSYREYRPALRQARFNGGEDPLPPLPTLTITPQPPLGTTIRRYTLPPAPVAPNLLSTIVSDQERERWRVFFGGHNPLVTLVTPGQDDL